jgi:4-amino-4-deoxy-L-arabinose transferase-like glycosyltransferase
VLFVRSTTVKSWFNRLKDAATGYLARHNRVRCALPIVGEIALVVAIITFAAFRFWRPPSEAANMPQESGKYAIGAWNLYKNGRYELFLNHQPYPAPGGLGYAYLIVPSFWLFGEFLGNAIYTQLALATLVCVAVYVAVRLCFGLWAAAFAAVLPALYPAFDRYARMNDTSIPSAFFFVVGLLIFLWILRDARAQFIKWALWGLSAGWATAVRTNNAPVFVALTIALLWLLHARPRQLARYLLAAAIGAAPLVAPVLLFNYHYCGSCLRDAHAFWESNPFDNFSRVFSFRYAFGFPENSSEILYHGMLLFYLREIACQFSDWPREFRVYDALVRVFIFFLSGVMIVGIACGLRRVRQGDRARQFVCFATVTVGITLLFYCFYWYGHRRFIVPAAPFCASFVGAGAVDMIRWLWRRRFTATLIPAFVLALAIPPYHWARGRIVIVGDWAPNARIFRFAAANIENDAVIIADTHWDLLEHFVIRNTERTYIPLRNRLRFRVQPRPPKDPSKIPLDVNAPYEGALEDGAVDLFDFTALEAPERIQRLLDKQYPVYVIDWHLRDEPSGSGTYELLSQHFELQRVARVRPAPALQPNSPPIGIVLWKLKSRIPLVN